MGVLRQLRWLDEGELFEREEGWRWRGRAKWKAEGVEWSSGEGPLLEAKFEETLWASFRPFPL
jgi:hypothetical protein